MKNVDFGTWFHEAKFKKNSWKVRFDHNFDHDLSYLGSYLHDAEIKMNEIRFRNKRLVIPIDRDGWEFFDAQSSELLGVDAEIVIHPVQAFYITLPHSLAEGRTIAEKITITGVATDRDCDLSGTWLDLYFKNKTTGFEIKVRMDVSRKPQLYFRDL